MYACVVTAVLDRRPVSARMYYAGMDSYGQPQWTSNEDQAQLCKPAQVQQLINNAYQYGILPGSIQCS